MNIVNFYENTDYSYSEIAICLENSDDGTGKFFIPVLTPFLSKDEPYDKKDVDISRINILNKDDVNLNISTCTTSNYVKLLLPDNQKICKKGEKYIISFIGGDSNKPCLSGRYIDDN